MHFVNIDGKRTDSEKFCPYQRQTERCTMKNKKLATSLQVGVNNILTQPFSSPRNSRNKRPSIGRSIMYSTIDGYENERLRNLISRHEYHSRINLYEQNLNDDDIKIVVQWAINEKRCNELWLEQNQITSVGASIIAKGLNNNSTLMWLSLSSNHLDDHGIEVLADVLTWHNSTLTTLALHATGITDQSVKYLAEMLKRNRTLMELRISGNNITDRGVQLLANTLTYHNNTLRWLYLSKNPSIGDACIDYLLEMLGRNGKLQELAIDNCNLSTDGKQRLQTKALLKTSFTLKI